MNFGASCLRNPFPHLCLCDSPSLAACCPAEASQPISKGCFPGFALYRLPANDAVQTSISSRPACFRSARRVWRRGGGREGVAGCACFRPVLFSGGGSNVFASLRSARRVWRRGGERIDCPVRECAAPGVWIGCGCCIREVSSSRPPRSSLETSGRPTQTCRDGGDR